MLVTEEKIDAHDRGEFRRAAESAFPRIEAAAQSSIGRGQNGGIDRLALSLTKCLARILCTKTFRVLVDFRAARRIGVRNGFEHATKAWTTIAVIRREIRAAENRHTRGEQKNPHRPTAAAGHDLNRAHVNLIEIRTLL